MIFIEQKIPGVFLINQEPFKMVSDKDMLHEDYL